MLETYRPRPGATVTRRPGGWPLAEYERSYPGIHSCRSVLPRRARGLEPCTRTAEWRVEHRTARQVSTGYYCLTDLPEEDAPDFRCPVCQDVDCQCPEPEET